MVVRKTYYYVPFRELRRRAEHDDKLAKRLYPAVAYGGSLRVLLWLYIGLMSAVAIILLARSLPVWVSLLIVGPLLWAAFSWLPASRMTKIGANLTLFVTPIITWLLNYLNPILSLGSRTVEQHITIPKHTGLFERSDLIELIEQQQRQHDSRLNDDELEIARRALSFTDYKVSDVLIPRKKIKVVSAKDNIGPVLIDELHKNGLGYMLVRETPKGPFVGTLAFNRLGLKSTGQVQSVMDRHVYYLHENDSLSQALHAFFVTNCPVFVVTNSSEEFVGMLAVDNILRQLLGHVPGDEFEDYSDISAVAARHIKPAKKNEEKRDGAADAHDEASESKEQPDSGRHHEQAEAPVKTEE